MITVRNLATGMDMTFANVGEAVWRDTGAVLAMSISSAERAGNGVQLYDAATGALRVLDSSPSQYLGLAWRRDAADLLVMRGKTDDKKEGIDLPHTCVDRRRHTRGEAADVRSDGRREVSSGHARRVVQARGVE